MSSFPFVSLLGEGLFAIVDEKRAVQTFAGKTVGKMFDSHGNCRGEVRAKIFSLFFLMLGLFFFFFLGKNGAQMIPFFDYFSFSIFSYIRGGNRGGVVVSSGFGQACFRSGETLG